MLDKISSLSLVQCREVWKFSLEDKFYEYRFESEAQLSLNIGSPVIDNIFASLVMRILARIK